MTAQNLHFIKILNSEKVAFGTYDNLHRSKTKTGKFLLRDLTDADLRTHLHLDKSRKTLIFIHGWLSHLPYYEKHGIQKFQKITALCPEADVENIIQIVWRPPHLFYKKSWQRAPNHGKNISDLVKRIAQIQDGQLIIACHSMGHRVFQGVLDTWEMPTHQPIFEKILMFAPDLDTDAFDNAYKNLPTQTERITIYRNEKDRSLWGSRWLHRRKRLGKQGFLNPPTAENIEMINITKNKDQRMDILRHIYHEYPSVQRDAARVLSNDFERREVVKGDDYQWFIKR